MPDVTEQVLSDAIRIDLQGSIDAAKFIAERQVIAAQSVSAVSAVVSQGAGCMADSIRAGNVLYYAAAGSSGLMAAADAMELGGTFNVPGSQVKIVMAGGLPGSASMPGDTEDQTETAQHELSAIKSGDTMIAVSASGNTPFTVAAAEVAKKAGATVIGIANNDRCKLLELSDYPVFLNTPAEVVAGSTRLGAGTAQKIALNSLSTLMAIELGHIYDGMMVNLRADNAKLRQRAFKIVAQSVQVSDEVALKALKQSRGNVKLAVLLAAGAASTHSASQLLDNSGGQLRTALSRLNN